MRDVASQLHGLSWAVHRLLPSLGSDLVPVPASELAVLQRIVAEPGVTVSELTIQLDLRQSNTSALVRTLLERGLVHRASSPTDGRVALRHPAGQALKNKKKLKKRAQVQSVKRCVNCSPKTLRRFSMHFPH